MVIFSPGNTTGFSALARSLMLSTSTRCSCATLFRLKSLVTTLASHFLASSSSFRSTSLIEGKSSGRSGSAGCVGLHALQHVQAAAAALAFGAVGRIGDDLQLAQHEFGDHVDAVNEAGFGDVGDAAVDDDRGVEHLEAFARRLFAGEDGAERRWVQQVALAGADQQANVGHEQSTKTWMAAEVGPAGRAERRTMQKSDAPKMPSTLPVTAPMSRRRFRRGHGAQRR
jgi:hypothetical protein